MTYRTCEDFIQRQLVEYSVASCVRAIPSLDDGFKETQRKIIYAMRKKYPASKGSTVTVPVICGTVTEMTEYGHGLDSLQKTLLGMTHTWIGSNNIALIFGDGQVGSREDQGSSAAARYLSALCNDILNHIIRKEDDCILTYKEGETGLIEPEVYYPIIPLVLINGSSGIGTGYSTAIPAFNPLDILQALRMWIKSGEVKLVKKGGAYFSVLQHFVPWYMGYTGSIVYDHKNNRYEIAGVLNRINSNTVEITELPIGKGTFEYIEFLKGLKDNNKLKKFLNYSTQSRVHFVITEEDTFKCTLKNMALITTFAITNMTLHNSDSKIIKYTTVHHILYDYAKKRLEMYEKRKEVQLNNLKDELFKCTIKRRFVEEVITEKIVVFRKKKSDICDVLVANAYPKIEDKYDYLLHIPIDSFTQDLIDKLDGMITTLTGSIATTETTSARDMWLRELDEFEKAYISYVKDWDRTENLLNKKKK